MAVLPTVTLAKLRVPSATRRRFCLQSTLVRTKGLELSVRLTVLGDQRPPSQSSKTVLSTVHVGGPKWMVGGTVFEMWLGAL